MTAPVERRAPACTIGATRAPGTARIAGTAVEAGR